MTFDDTQLKLKDDLLDKQLESLTFKELYYCCSEIIGEQRTIRYLKQILEDLIFILKNPEEDLK